jgi:peptidyl-prolyl cis-trans isomerase B (cyclophilin B)
MYAGSNTGRVAGPRRGDNGAPQIHPHSIRFQEQTVRNVIALIALVAVAIGITALFSRPPTPEPPPDTTAKADYSRSGLSLANREKAYEQARAGAVHATLVIADRGTLGIEMYPYAAPQTVAHIVSLCKHHFYDGQLFHRYVPGFVIQVGDPASKRLKPSDLASLSPDQVSQQYHLGVGGSGETVPLEIKLFHLPNTLGLARADTPHSGDSQFFINLVDNSRLDTGYCAFGRVVSGLDVVPKLRQGDRIVSFTVQ